MGASVKIQFSLISLLLLTSVAHAENFWIELQAKDKYERTAIAQQGFDIVSVEKDRVVVFASEEDLQKAYAQKILISSFRAKGPTPFDFPIADRDFHNYTELSDDLESLATKNPNLVQLFSIGRSYEKREIQGVRISAVNASPQLPASLFVGGHHAREHVAVEIPLRLAEYLIQEYKNKNPRIVALLNSSEVFIIPLLNPDGAEFDVATGVYQGWRKNRRENKNKTYGVDLNRNYDSGWGTTGISLSAGNDTYPGTKAFSEPESLAFKNFIESHTNITSLISYHTYGKLVLWPWGYSDDEIPDKTDLAAFELIGKKMAQWNKYQPMKSGELYLASGDACDWAYAEHGIFAFTFELDPGEFGGGGFYPGQGILDDVFQKNIEPALYLMEIADNPLKVLKP